VHRSPGLGLSAAAGPERLHPAAAGRRPGPFTGVITLPEPYQWIQSGWALAVVSVLLVAELVLDKVPVVDHVNDVVQTLVRPTVGRGHLRPPTNRRAEQADSIHLDATSTPGIGVGASRACGRRLGVVHRHPKGTPQSRPLVNVGTLRPPAPPVVKPAAEDGRPPWP
jgi:hypothetical protein